MHGHQEPGWKEAEMTLESEQGPELMLVLLVEDDESVMGSLRQLSGS